MRRRTSPTFRAAPAGSSWPAALGLATCVVVPLLWVPAPLQAQAVPSAYGPIAIVPLDSKNPDQAANVTGALEVSQGRAIIAASGTVSSGSQTTEVVLPHRGMLRVCASTTVKLAADTSVPAGGAPGLLMAMDHGALEMSFASSTAAGRNSDILMTPDFRILIAGPGAADVKVRLGQHGDTCVDNSGANAPYVLVTGVFDSGNYRVQPGQRVMFEHGSLHEVVDQEKEPCGCPPPAKGGNEFPLAQSEGLAPAPKVTTPVTNPAPANPGGGPAQDVQPLVYKSSDRFPQPATGAPSTAGANAAPPANAPAAQPAEKKKPGFFGGIGRFFRRIFGAE